ncbi:MAG: ester cyclase [Candidatus Binatia bacterium]|nr:ester cyclase [Candidatus Binatia bacterium]
MSAENKAVFRRYFEEVLNAGNLDLVDDLIARSYVSHYPTGYDFGGGPEGVKQIVSAVRTGFPDVHFTVEDVIAEGDRVVGRWTFRGTHQGDFMGIPPTGRKVSVMGIAIYRIARGKIAEAWVAWDAMGLMQQLGAVP